MSLSGVGTGSLRRRRGRHAARRRHRLPLASSARGEVLPVPRFRRAGNSRRRPTPRGRAGGRPQVARHGLRGREGAREAGAAAVAAGLRQAPDALLRRAVEVVRPLVSHVPRGLPAVRQLRHPLPGGLHFLGGWVPRQDQVAALGLFPGREPVRAVLVEPRFSLCAPGGLPVLRDRDGRRLSRRDQGTSRPVHHLARRPRGRRRAVD
mmetsp:Transcript_67130/g.189085  ORF Transcript_67130/g.189085 Transcript_67130/m.189085 type:complete len:207 (-) Transcript_67130:3-623(-)